MPPSSPSRGAPYWWVVAAFFFGVSVGDNLRQFHRTFGDVRNNIRSVDTNDAWNYDDSNYNNSIYNNSNYIHTQAPLTEGQPATSNNNNTSKYSNADSNADSNYFDCNNDATTTPSNNATTTTPQLSFVHIPKTGGSTIELAAKKQSSKKWGWHHWEGIDVGKGIYLWHLPPSIIPSLFDHRKVPLPDVLPYDGDELFGVIRNPFARIVSEVFYKCGLSTGRACLKKSKVNQRLQSSLQKKLNCNSTLEDCYIKDDHFIPQWHYFYDQATGSRQIRYLVHFENLSGDFDDLMDAHSINISLAKQQRARARVYKNDTADDDFQGVEDLTPEIQRMIRELYRLDFELGGYSMETDELQSYAVSSSSTARNNQKTFLELPCLFDKATKQHHHRKRHRYR